MKKLLFLTFLFLNFSILNAKNLIKVGVTGGPHAQVMEAVKKVAKEKYNLEIKIIEFSDYIQPNSALNSGDLDANSYQHKPFLDLQIEDRNYPFIVIGNTINFPFGIYSNKIKDLKDLKNGAKFGIPNDPTNGGRALLLLQEQGLIKLNPKAGLKATILDIIENPKKIKFIELEAPQLGRSLNDLDAAAINTNFAIASGLSPMKDAFVTENKNSPYVNVLVVNKKDKNQEWTNQLLKSYQSQEIKDFINQTFQGEVIIGF